MHLKEIFIIVLSLLPQIYSARSPEEFFDEHLDLRPLNDGRVATRFLFTTSLKKVTPRLPQALSEDDRPQHYKLFPLSLGQILREHAVAEIHLSMNAGKWNYKGWGYPRDEAVATGAELWAWMGDSDSSSIDERWKGLRNALAGLFCASLGSLDDSRTTSPAYAFRPEGSLPAANSTYHIRHASLPSEHVCTENLTPFLKLLPCRSAAGIASLLNPHRLFDADWHGLGIHVRWSEAEGVALQMSVQAVFDPVRLSFLQKRDFSFRTLFDRAITKACPVARESRIQIPLPEASGYTITPEPSKSLAGNVVFNAREMHEDALDISVHWPNEPIFSYATESPKSPLIDFEVLRTLTGSTQSRGQLSIQIRNHLPFEMSAIYLETMPWLVQFYLHTIKITIGGEPRNDLMARIAYIPPEAHGRPTLFEALLTLPPASTLQLTMDVTKSFLRYTEHPPDAQRGWDLPPAVLIPIRPALNGSSDGQLQARLQRIYSPAVLVDLATPDFSMPYNVIIMSSTLIALIFGSIFNLLTRRFVALSVEGTPRREAAQ